MIRDADADQYDSFAPADFETPFGAGLDTDNRWVRWAQRIPWSELAASYYATLKPTGLR